MVAITFDENIIITDPIMIHRIVNGLLKSKQYWFSSCPIAGRDLGIIFENKKTGMMFQAAINVDKKIIQSVNWESKELYPVFLKILGIDEKNILEAEKDMWTHKKIINSNLFTVEE